MSRIPHNGSACWNVFDDHGTHSDNSAFANGYALADKRAGSNVSTIANGDVTVAIHARGKGDIIANDALVRNVAVNVGVKMPANLGLGFNDSMMGDYRTFANTGMVGNYRGRCADGGELVQGFGDAPARVTVSYGDAISGLSNIGGMQDGNPAKTVRPVVAYKANVAAIFDKCLDGIEHLKRKAASAVNRNFHGVGVLLAAQKVKPT